VRRLLAAIALVATLGAQANVDVYRFDDPEKAQRYQQLISELRCLVCQNQNLADSNAELAHDLRRQTYEMIRGGKSDKEVVDFMVTRYGDFVLYRPPLRTRTVLLWAGPFLLLLAGLVVMFRYVRQRARPGTEAVDPEQLRRARDLLGDRDPNK